MPIPAAPHSAIVADTLHTADTTGTRLPASQPEVFVPQYIGGFERSTPLKESDPLKDLQETIIAIPEGFSAERMPDTPTNNSLLVSIVVVVFLLFAFTFKKGTKFLGEIFNSVLNVKDRQNLFDDTTVRETQLRAVLLGMTCVSEGFCLFQLLASTRPDLSISIGVGVCCGSLIAWVYYTLQKWLYRGLGLVFSDTAHTRKWVESFISINAIISIPIAVPVLLSIFVPQWGKVMLVVAGVIYLASRILFIYKGFKIFYRNILDLFYFIVYFCALEITPLFWVYKSSVLIYNFVELKLQQL